MQIRKHQQQKVPNPNLIQKIRNRQNNKSEQPHLTPQNDPNFSASKKNNFLIQEGRQSFTDSNQVNLEKMQSVNNSSEIASKLINKKRNSFRGMTHNGYVTPRTGVNLFDQSKGFGKSSMNSTFMVELNSGIMSPNMNMSNYMTNNGSFLGRKQSSQKSLAMSVHSANFNDSIHLLDQGSELFTRMIGEKDRPAYNVFLKKNEEDDLDTNFPNYEVKEGIPKSIDFFEKKCCYIWIDTYRRKFPAHIVTDIRGKEFEYYINFDKSKRPIINNFVAHTYKRSAHSFIENVTSTVNSINNYQNQSKLINFDEYFDKPSKNSCDLLLIGNAAHINLPTKKDSVIKEGEFNYQVVCIKSPKALKCSFTVSFTNEKYFQLQEKIHCDVFSENHKTELFGNQIGDYEKHIELMKSKRVTDLHGIMKGNREKVTHYNKIRLEFTRRNQSNRNVRTVEAIVKRKEVYRHKREAAISFLQRNDYLKEQSRLEKEEREILVKKYMTKYLWFFLIRFYSILDRIDGKFRHAKQEKLKFEQRNLKALLIQRTFRYRMRFLSSAENRNRKITINLIKLRMNWVADFAYDRAKDMVGDFFEATFRPTRAKNLCLRYILTIKNIQRQMMKHVQIKKAAVEKMENNWTKELIKLVEKQKEYKEMGIDYNLEHIQLIGKEMRIEICHYMVDRQILRYCDTKYEFMEKECDKKIAQNVEKMVKLDNELVADNRENRASMFSSRHQKRSIFNKDFKTLSIGAQIASSITLHHQLEIIDDDELSHLKANHDKKFEFGESGGSDSELSKKAKDKADIIEKSQSQSKFKPILKKQNSSQHSDMSIEKDPSNESMKSGRFASISPKKFQLLSPEKQLTNEEKLQHIAEVRDNVNMRISQRNARRSYILSDFKGASTQSIKMLFDDSNNKYVYDSTKLWSHLELRQTSDLYLVAMKKIPEIVNAEQKAKKAQQTKEANDNEKSKKKNTKTPQNSNGKKVLKQITKEEKDPQAINESEMEAFQNLASLLPPPKTDGFDCTIESNVMRGLIISTLDHVGRSASLTVGAGGFDKVFTTNENL